MSEETKEPEQVAEVWDSILGALVGTLQRFRAAYAMGGSGRNRERAQCCYTIIEELRRLRKDNQSKYVAKSDDAK